MNINDIINYLKNYDGEDITIMEICGTHTASISKNGIPSLLSNKIHLVSGPGCPVCVTVSDYVDKLIDLARQDYVIIAFGDMLRVPGKSLALKDAKAEGCDIRMVYSPLDAVLIAKSETDKQFVFAAVGFETTTPIYAVMIEQIINEQIENLKILSALKTMPNVIDKLCWKENFIDGFIAPGHVAAITGSDCFELLAKKHNVPFAVSGFEAEEILCSIYSLVKLKGKGKLLNLYKSVVKEEYNANALQLVEKYFEPCDSSWRGLGIIEKSGLVLKDIYKKYDAGSKDLNEDYSHTNGCKCGEVISGISKPSECPLYSVVCKPESPKGACMVSAEGSCFNYITNNRD